METSHCFLISCMYNRNYILTLIIVIHLILGIRSDHKHFFRGKIDRSEGRYYIRKEHTVRSGNVIKGLKSPFNSNGEFCFDYVP